MVAGNSQRTDIEVGGVYWALVGSTWRRVRVQHECGRRWFCVLWNVKHGIGSDRARRRVIHARAFGAPGWIPAEAFVKRRNTMAPPECAAPGALPLIMIGS